MFGEADRAQSAADVLGRWEDLKRDERAAAGAPVKTTLGGVPKTLPALLRAYEYGSRAASVGFDWERASDVIGKIEEEIQRGARVRSRTQRQTRPPLEEEMGDLLFAIANLSRKLGVEPENALRARQRQVRGAVHGAGTATRGARPADEVCRPGRPRGGVAAR